MKITRLDPQTRQPTADSWTLSRACRQLTIGRAAPAEILLDSPDVSPRHAALVWQSGTLVVRDLASINGIVLRNARVLRATLQDRDVFSIGGIPFQIAAEPADYAARRARLLLLGGLTLGGLLLAALVSALIRDAKTAAPAAAPEEPSPLAPLSADPAFQKMSDQYASAAELLDESRRIIADGLDDLGAAQRLQQALALNPNLSEAALLLAGLQGSHSAAIQKQIDDLVAAGQFTEALAALERQKALVGAPDAVQQTQAKISQRIQYRQALAALDQGELDQAETLLKGLSAEAIPELPDAQARLAKCRAAVAWADLLERKADENDLTAVQKMADAEILHAPFLSADALSEVHGALARANAFGDIQKLVADGNVYVLAQYLRSGVPGLDDLLRPLRASLAPRTDEFRHDAEQAAARAGAAPVPADLDDARASYAAAQAFAALCIVRGADDDFRQQRRHAERWNAYLAAVAARAQTYVAQGARAEARAILDPLLPYLDEYDEATQPLRQLAAQIAPVPFTPETAHYLADRSSSKSDAP